MSSVEASTPRLHEVPGQAVTMSTDDLSTHLADSGITMRSDSEQYSPGDEVSSPSSSNSPVILYKPPTAWNLIRSAAINLVLPFINGMMLGFGELFAHEAAFRLGWGGTKVSSMLTGLSLLSNVVSRQHKPRPFICQIKWPALKVQAAVEWLTWLHTGFPSFSKTSPPHWPRHRSP